jgi:glycine C-acetyltransferase
MGCTKKSVLSTVPQAAVIEVNGNKVINFCANNYLGLANHPKLIQAASRGLEKWGFGLSSVRFICGTQAIHRELENKISEFLSTEDSILYTSCFDANAGLFETILTEEDAIISDELNHASIIDGVRLCKASRYRYKHADLSDLEQCLQKSQSQRHRLIATDGVFSMDGDVALLSEICDLAENYNAMVMVDDSHATGFFGPTGRGTIEYAGVSERVDIITSTLGKALGGASGGFTTGKKEIIELLRQRSRPYLFSNSLPPALVCASIAVLELLSETTELRDRLDTNTQFFRKALVEAGFNIRSGVHPIIPIMLGDAKLASDIAKDMLKEGIYVIGFSYPVVPKGQARIRVQISAAHTQEQLIKAVETFIKVGKRFRILNS